MDEHARVDPTDSTTEAELVLVQERLAVATQRHESGRVRVSKRVVTEERTVTVRREVLVVEDVAASAGSGRTDALTAPEGGGARPVLELTLSEEEVRTVVVPRERVRVFVDQVSTTEQVTADVAREDVELIQIPAEPGTTHQGVPS